MMAKPSKLKIERTGPAHNSDVRLTATIPWKEMNFWVMENMRQRCGESRALEEDTVLIAGAIPALVELVGQQRPQAMWGPLNAYAWELEGQRDRLARRNPKNRDEEAWLNVRLETVAVLLRELRFAEMTADGTFKRSELLEEERLLGGVEYRELKAQVPGVKADDQEAAH